MPQGKYKLTVPLDASKVADFSPGQEVKVAVSSAGKVVQAQKVELGKACEGQATFAFDERPGSLRVLVGPAATADEELPKLQTLSVDVAPRQWADKSALALTPIQIHPYYWHWWMFWCRKFTIHGRLVGADECPVPGAEVCAYDVDWWLYWQSSQLVGCATTDENGAFTIEFNWCCGWWPWWWWRLRAWEIDRSIAARIQPIFERDPDLRLEAGGSQPSLEPFSALLAQDGLDAGGTLSADPTILERLRQPLLERLPSSPELEALSVWPWSPWTPWWDCTPDIIFKATQNCLGETKVVLEESYSDTRWNIPTTLSVTLHANDDACCLPPTCQDPCPEGQCLVVDEVCAYQVDQIGGNQSPPLAPEGFLNPGGGAAPYPPGAAGLDRPFAGIVPVYRIGRFEVSGSVVVDYYEILDDALNPLPAAAEVDFCRTYWTGDPGHPWKIENFDFQHRPGLPAGHRAVESRERRGVTAGIDEWRWSQNRDLLVPLDSRRFADGTYRFKVRGWQADGSGHLINPVVLPLCDNEEQARFSLAFDNRGPVPEPGHDVSHNCGPVHVCTSEPDCHIEQVRVNGVPVDVCGTVDGASGDLEIEFMVGDPNGHLSHYALYARYGVNGSIDLIHGAGGVLSPTVAGPIQVGPSYGDAVNQGATPPNWFGGRITLTVPAAAAFPVPCCYQLVLVVYKRTVVGTAGSGCRFSCHTGWPHRNRSQFTVGVGVCPPLVAPTLSPERQIDPGLPGPVPELSRLRTR